MKLVSRVRAAAHARVQRDVAHLVGRPSQVAVREREHLDRARLHARAGGIVFESQVYGTVPAGAKEVKKSVPARVEGLVGEREETLRERHDGGR